MAVFWLGLKGFHDMLSHFEEGYFIPLSYTSCFENESGGRDKQVEKHCY